MNKNLFLFVVFICLACSGQNKNLKVKCTLLKYEPTTIHCGTQSVWVGVKFQRMDSNSTFIGLINCPEVYDSSFWNESHEYSIEMSNKIPSEKQNLIINVFESERLPIFKIEEIEIVQPHKK